MKKPVSAKKLIPGGKYKTRPSASYFLHELKAPIGHEVVYRKKKGGPMIKHTLQVKNYGRKSVPYWKPVETSSKKRSNRRSIRSRSSRRRSIRSRSSRRRSSRRRSSRRRSSRRRSSRRRSSRHRSSRRRSSRRRSQKGGDNCHKTVQGGG